MKINPQNFLLSAGALLVSIFFFSALPVLASGPVLQWVKPPGFVSVGTAVDGVGDVYVLGLTGDASNAYTTHIAKFDSAGNLLWSKIYFPGTFNAATVYEFNGSHPNLGGLQIDSSGNLYVGLEISRGDCDSWDWAAMKVDSAGNIIWTRIPAGQPGYGTGWATGALGIGYNPGVYFGTDPFGVPICGGWGSGGGTFSSIITDSGGNTFLRWAWINSYSTVPGAYGYNDYDTAGNAVSSFIVADTIVPGPYPVPPSMTGADGLGNFYSIWTPPGVIKFNTAGTILWNKAITTSCGAPGYLSADGSGITVLANCPIQANNLPGGYALTRADLNGNVLWSSPVLFVGETGQGIKNDSLGNSAINSEYLNGYVPAVYDTVCSNARCTATHQVLVSAAYYAVRDYSIKNVNPAGATVWDTGYPSPLSASQPSAFDLSVENSSMKWLAMLLPGGVGEYTFSLVSASISVNPTSIVLGQSATLTWSSTNATACTASNAWSGAQAISGSISVSPASVGSYTYTITCTDAVGNVSTPQSKTLTVSAAAVGSISVSSVSTLITSVLISSSINLVTVQPYSTYVPAQTAPGFPGPGHTSAFFCPVNTVMCGIHSSGLDNQGTILADQPLCCTWTPDAQAAGLSVGGGVTQIDSSANGGSMSCPAGQIVNGAVWAKSYQIDYGECQALKATGAATSLGTPTLVTASAPYTDYYCPPGSLLVGGQNAPAKNDSWNGFYCAPVHNSAGAPITISKVVTSSSPLKPLSSSWDLPGSVPSHDPCGVIAPCSGTGQTYSGATADTYTLFPGPAPAGFSLGGVKRVIASAPQPKSSLFSRVWSWITKVARAANVLNGAGIVAPTQTLAPGSAITFVIEWLQQWTITSVTVSPPSVTLSAGQTQQFSAVVQGTGSFDSSVSWSVNGIVGGNASVGTISATGFYTPPAGLLAPITVTIRATSNSDSSKFGSATATVNTAVSCSPATQTVNVGQNDVLTALGGDNVSYTWSAPPDGIPLAGGPGSSFSVNYATTGTRSIFVSSGGSSAQCTVNVTKIDCSFTASPSSIISPSTSTLAWSCTNVTGCGITSDQGDNFPGVTVPSSTLSVAPTSTTTYTLSCNNGFATYQASVGITVLKPKVIEL